MRSAIYVAVVSAVSLGCGDHDPEIGRVGGRIPNHDAANVEPDAANIEEASTDSGVVPWCPTVYEVMTVCRRCHHEEPRPFGAPFPLLKYDDTQQPYASAKVWNRMVVAVSTNFMPLQGTTIDPPAQPLTPADKNTLLAWLEQGALDVGGRACEPQ